MSKLSRWTSVAVIVALCAIVSAGAHAQGAGASKSTDSASSTRPSEKMTLIRQLLSRTQAVEQAISMMETSLPAQKQSNPRIPPVFWDRMLAEARAGSGDLADRLALVYERHFTTEEIRQLLQFYETPIGRKLLATLPAITLESMQAGQEWGQRIGAKIGAQLAAEGVFITP
jgi:hypothetical protein